ncbi:aldehyde dehydrogenase (NADP(+)) [Myceligenerans pegani]|uniref:Aldehyde dehydrogenase (NADP(+)) n=1 Tax=Myceligenerans pegani TaxID=2776917 RepID=A0ABR9N1V2_9MICO|nr:aldehyde dehydrogenase (NADP(+)) [Myceligenerans sp. TRM 65318]MBE1877636.1 aldehyde dehydrogenase (NADP(+)) [Myceligenerans sp. TRM 65318]MBE3019907.1 aldehyde dehydrogenase (NADP(+)) [Myceligenerans sp. TRM 65318]
MSPARPDVTDIADVVPGREVKAAVRRTTRPERARWLRAVADALDEARDELVAVAARETGLPTGRLYGEVARTTGQLRLFADVVLEGGYLEATIDHAVRDATQPRPDLRRWLVPVGTVAVYSASNFPFAFSVAGGDTASALAAGCPVVVKAHPGHGSTSRRTARIVTAALHDAGAPDGLFGLVEGFEAGISLIEHPDVDAGAFTGSVRGGRALADRAAGRTRPIPFYGELGSINPVVVTEAADDAHGAALAAGLASSFTLGVGQFCTKPGVVLVPTGSKLAAALPGLVEPGAMPMLTDTIAAAYVAGTRRLAGVEGVAEVLAPDGPGSPAVYSVGAERFAAAADVLTEEVFGPATVLVTYDGADELQAAVDALPGSLTATIHGTADDDLADLADQLSTRAGRVLFDGWPTGVAVTWAQHHGGPWPATNTQHTSVGATALRRFLRPVVYQDAPEHLLPPELRDDSTVPRRVDGALVARKQLGSLPAP